MAFRVSSTDALVSVVLFIVCKAKGTFLEISTVSSCCKSDDTKCFKKLNKSHAVKSSALAPGNFMSTLCIQIQLPMHVEMRATQVAKKINDLDLLTSKCPKSIV